MAVVTELVTEFKFEGDTKPLKETGDQMQRVSENSGIASKRMDGASDSFMGMSKTAQAGVGALVALGATIFKTSKEILEIGKEADRLFTLGINPAELRDFQDLFVEMGAGADGATQLVEQIKQAQNLLRRGKESPFLNNLIEQFNVAFDSTDSVDEIIRKLRKRVRAESMDIGQVSTLVGNLGLDASFSKVLIATEAEFSNAVKTSMQYAKVTKEQLKVTQQLNDEFNRLQQDLKRLTESVLVDFADELLAITKFIRGFVKGDMELRSMRGGLGMAGLDAKVLRAPISPVIPLESMAGRLMRSGAPASPTQLNNITINVQDGDPNKIRMEMERFFKKQNNKTRALK